MKREQIGPFVLGLVAGVLLTLLVGGTVGGVLTYTMRERAIAAEQEALEQRQLAEEQALRAHKETEAARVREQQARQQAEEALEAERRRQKP